MIVLLVIVGAAIGGGVGVGVAIYFLQNRNVQQASVQVETSATTTSATPEASRIVEGLLPGDSVGKVEGQKGRNVDETKIETGEGSTQDTSGVAQVTLPEEDSADVAAGTVDIARKDTSEKLKPTLTPKTSPDIGSGVSVPTIDLSSTIDLSTPSTGRKKSTPSIPTVQPDIKKSTPTFTISTLSESEIKKVYYQEGNLAKAERMLRKELKRNPKSSLAKKYLRLIKLERQALALEAQGDSEGAKRIWQQIIRIAPDHPRAKKHLK